MRSKEKNSRLLSIIFCVFLLFLFLLVKYQGPVVVNSLYQNGRIDLLNTLTFAQGRQPLEFYSGQMEEFYLGPLGVLIAGIFLLFLSVNYLQGVSAAALAGIIFIFLVLTKFEVLFFPPYGELVAGPYAEASWLFRHSFDYAGLIQQDNFSQGGPKVYLFSVYPTIAALMMKFSPSEKFFLVINHLFIFGLASVIVAVFRSILLKLYDARTAILAAIILLSLPLFQCMTEMLHMEMLCLFFALLAAYGLIEKKVALAGGMAVLSALTKGSGGFACSSVLAVTLLIFFLDRKEKNRIRFLLIGILTFFLGFSQLFLWRLFIHKIQPAANAFRPFAGWQPLLETVKMEMLLFVLSLAVFLYGFIKARVGRVAGGKAISPKEHVTWVMFIFAGMWFALFLNVSVMGYRYELLLLPFLVFCVLFAFRSVVRSEKIGFGVLVLVILLSCIGSYGLFERFKYESSIYSYHKFERSLEYRNDMKLHLLLAEEIEKNFSGFTIGAPFVIAQMLGMPEFGYVHRPLDVVIYGMRCTYGGIRNFDGLKNLNISRTVWVGFLKNHIHEGIDFPVGPQDKILKEISVGNKRVVLFMGGFAIEKMRLIVELSRRGLLKEALKNQ